METYSTDKEFIYLAEFFLRIFLGILFFFQGYDKLINLKLGKVIETFQQEFESKKLPRFVHVLAAYFSSYTELIGGSLLLLGLFRGIALVGLGLDLVLVSLAFSYLHPLWDMRHVFPRFILLILLLLFPSENALFSMDYLFKK